MQYDIKTGKLIVPGRIEKIIKKLDESLRGRTDNKYIKILDEEDAKLN